jgi:hypothetical protein
VSGDYGYGTQTELRYLYPHKDAKWLATLQRYIPGDSRHYSVTPEAAQPVGNVPSGTRQRRWRYSLTFTWNFNNRH